MLEEEYFPVWDDIQAMDDATLARAVYYAGIEARRLPFEGEIVEYRIAETEHLVRLGALCEGCHNRRGCMMCCPWDEGDSLARALNREHEEMALGRPLFPNEY